ncbi:hypothetical protein QF028_004092 [Neobacillus sp. B4I6]|jgi:hypothetical protein
MNLQISERQMEFKEQFTKERGDWSKFWDGLLMMHGGYTDIVG